MFILFKANSGVAGWKSVVWGCFSARGGVAAGGAVRRGAGRVPPWRFEIRCGGGLRGSP